MNHSRGFNWIRILKNMFLVVRKLLSSILNRNINRDFFFIVLNFYPRELQNFSNELNTRILHCWIAREFDFTIPFFICISSIEYMILLKFFLGRKITCHLLNEIVNKCICNFLFVLLYKAICYVLYKVSVEMFDQKYLNKQTCLM